MTHTLELTYVRTYIKYTCCNCTFYRAVKEENAQLQLNVEVVNKQFSAVFSERESLKHEVHNQKAKEEGLQLLLQEREKEISEWKHAWDAQNQHLKAALATVSDRQNGSYERFKFPPFKSSTLIIL